MSSPPLVPEYCLFWIDHWATCMPRAEWSAWVQALGALLALGVTVGIAWQQSAARRQAQASHAEVLVTVGLTAITYHVSVLVKLKPGDVVAVDGKFLRDAIQPLDGIMSSPLQPAVLKRVVATRQLMLTLSNCIDDWSGRPVSSCSDLAGEIRSVKLMAEQIRAGH
jgi:hypothetical protein